MNIQNEFTGITENLLSFREEVKDANKVTFIGMPGVCSPFAELFAYVIMEKESVFITGTDITSARKIGTHRPGNAVWRVCRSSCRSCCTFRRFGNVQI